MKRPLRFLLSFFCAIAALMGTAALAESPAPRAVTLPAPIAAVFDDPAWNGWTPVALDDEAASAPVGIRAAVLMRRDGRSVLCLLERAGDAWVISRQTALAVYQDDRVPQMTFAETDVYTSRLTIRYEEGRNGRPEIYKWSTGNDSATRWSVSQIMLEEPGRGGITLYTKLQYYQAYVSYYEYTSQHADPAHATETERFYGKVNRLFGAFDINAYPRTIEQARFAFPTPPPLTPGEQRDALPAPIPAKALPGEWPILLGPDSTYERMPDAVVTQDSTVTAIVAEGAYALAAFADGDEPRRYGYLPLNALEPLPDLQDARFPYLRAAYEGEAVTEANLSANTPADGALLNTAMFPGKCTYLATLSGDWTYIETNIPKARGFVPSDAVRVTYDLDQYESVDATLPGTITRGADIVDDPYRLIEPKKLGEVKAGDTVGFVDTLYGQWALIVVTGEGDPLWGFIPRDAVGAPEGGYALEGNG